MCEPSQHDSRCRSSPDMTCKPWSAKTPSRPISPFSLISVMLTLYLLQITISVVVLIGVIMLAGTVVNNAIILGD